MPPRAALDGMQPAFVQAGLVAYDTPIRDDRCVDASLSREAAAAR